MQGDQQLMEGIKAKYGAAIAQAVAGTPYPAALLAALTANEGALDENASRLEPKVLGDLALTVTGTKAAYGSIGALDLQNYLAELMGKDAILALRNLAMSWGPTQIMGYHALAGGYAVAELRDPEKHYHHTVELLEGFRKQFNLVMVPTTPPISAEPFFRCWNSGSPNGRTFDPNYAGNGVNRFSIYEGLE